MRPAAVHVLTAAAAATKVIGQYQAIIYTVREHQPPGLRIEEGKGED